MPVLWGGGSPLKGHFKKRPWKLQTLVWATPRGGAVSLSVPSLLYIGAELPGVVSHLSGLCVTMIFFLLLLLLQLPRMNFPLTMYHYYHVILAVTLYYICVVVCLSTCDVLCASLKSGRGGGGGRGMSVLLLSPRFFVFYRAHTRGVVWWWWRLYNNFTSVCFVLAGVSRVCVCVWCCFIF